MNDRFFVPVCLYSKSQFRRKDEMRNLLNKISSRETLTVVCDFLHSYYLAITKPELPFERCIQRAMNAGGNVARMIQNICSTQGFDNVRVHRWNDFSTASGYKRLRKEVDQLYRAGQGFSLAVESYINKNLVRFGRTGDKTAYNWEREYLLSEVAMSLYIAEILGYSLEIWESRPTLATPGPMEFLYGMGQAELRKLIPAPPKREVVFLDEWTVAPISRNAAG